MHTVSLVKNYFHDGYECAIVRHLWPEVSADYLCGYLRLSERDEIALLRSATPNNSGNHGLAGKEVSYYGDDQHIREYFREFNKGDVIAGFDLNSPFLDCRFRGDKYAEQILASWVKQVKKAVAKDKAKQSVWDLGDGHFCVVMLGL